MDESAFYLNPKGNKYLIGRELTYAFKIVTNNEKECITTILGDNAEIHNKFSGCRQKLFGVLQKIGVWDCLKMVWVTSKTFFEYIANIFFYIFE